MAWQSAGVSWAANDLVHVRLADLRNEPPLAPATPVVTPVSRRSDRLTVTWSAPENAGRPVITSYDVQYREDGTTSWEDGPAGVSGTSTTLTGLRGNTLHRVRVRATNSKGVSGWSAPPGAGRTSMGKQGAGLQPGAVTLTVDENAPADQDIGDPVVATDPDDDILDYSLGGADATHFAIVSDSGQIRTRAGVTYDHEANSSYSVTVIASDGMANAEKSVTINVNDVDEPPAAPATPLVNAVSGSSTELTVSWTAPTNAGKPAITGYDVQYRACATEGCQGETGSWLEGPQDIATRSATISGLEEDTPFQVRVRASNDEGDSGWSDPPGSGRTNLRDNQRPGLRLRQIGPHHPGEHAGRTRCRGSRLRHRQRERPRHLLPRGLRLGGVHHRHDQRADPHQGPPSTSKRRLPTRSRCGLRTTAAPAAAPPSKSTSPTRSSSRVSPPRRP